MTSVFAMGLQGRESVLYCYRVRFFGCLVYAWRIGVVGYRDGIG